MVPENTKPIAFEMTPQVCGVISMTPELNPISVAELPVSTISM